MSVHPFHMSLSNLRLPWPIYFKFHRVIGIDGLTVCIIYGEISNFHSRVMGLYSSNCRQFFICCAVNWEPLGQFTSNFAQLLELIVSQSVYFLVKFRFFIQELWERKSTDIVWRLTTGVSCALGAAVYFSIASFQQIFVWYWTFVNIIAIWAKRRKTKTDFFALLFYLAWCHW